jgi:hypothetical protein
MGKKEKRAEELAARLGKAPKTPSIPSSGGIAGAAGQSAAAYFAAEATKEVARQQTHQAAIGANSGIMHELDRPMIDLRANIGTAKKPAEVNVTMSILSLYMLGVMAEKVNNDMIDASKGLKTGQFIEHVLPIRAPLTEISGGERLGVGAAAGAGTPTTPAGTVTTPSGKPWSSTEQMKWQMLYDYAPTFGPGNKASIKAAAAKAGYTVS